MIAKRLVTLYTTPQTSTLEVILGASSLDDMLNRVDTASRVSSLDSEVLDRVNTFRSDVKRHAVALAKARAATRRLVAQRAAERRSVADQLDQRRALLSSINGEIARIEAQIAAAAHARELQAAQAARSRIAEAQTAAQQDFATSVVGASAATPEGATVVPPSGYSGVVGVAMQYLGTPYVWAGASPGGFDCSGLVMYAYAQVGDLAAALVVRDVERRRAGPARPAPAGRPRLLRRARPRRHVRRRRLVHPRAAHRHRRAGLEPRQLVRLLVRRRARASSGRPRRKPRRDRESGSSL